MKGDVALIVGAGAGTSASCARTFADAGFSVAVAARNPEKAELKKLEDDFGATRFGCDAADEAAVADLFSSLDENLGTLRVVIHNIDGRTQDIFRKTITEAPAEAARQTLLGSAFSAFLVGQQAAARMLKNEPDENGARGTIIFTNASAAMKGFARSGAFAMACQAKQGLAQSMARELMPQGVHVAHVPIDAAIGRVRDDGTRAHWAAGETVDDNMAHPEEIAKAYLALHQQHRSTWAFEMVLRPWTERW